MLPESDDDVPESTLPPAAELNLKSETADIVVGLTLTLFAVWFLVQSIGLPDYSGTAIGAADFPKGLAILLILGSLGLVCAAGWRLLTDRTGQPSTIRRPLRIGIGILLLGAFPGVMAWAGYYIAMALFLAAFLWLADIRRVGLIAACVAGFLLFTKIVFEMILRTPLS